MKINVLTILLLTLSLQIFAQKVDIKKGIVTVNKDAYLNLEKNYGKEIVSTLKDKQIATLTWYSFEIPNPARQNANDPSRHKYPATIKKYYVVVDFLDFDLTFETDITRKNLFEAFYNNNLVLGHAVIEANARKIEKIISKNISEHQPGIVITY